MTMHMYEKFEEGEMDWFDQARSKRELFDDTREYLTSKRNQSDSELELLTSFVKNDGTYVDIGAWMGVSARAIAQKMIDKGIKGKVLALDPCKLDKRAVGYLRCRRLGLNSTKPFLDANLEEWGVADRVDVRTELSQDVGRKYERCDVPLISIDGSHAYQDVVDDFKLWYPHVQKGGFIAFHDYENVGGPTRVIDEIVRPAMGKEVGAVGWLRVFQKARLAEHPPRY